MCVIQKHVHKCYAYTHTCIHIYIYVYYIYTYYTHFTLPCLTLPYLTLSCLPLRYVALPYITFNLCCVALLHCCITALLHYCITLLHYITSHHITSHHITYIHTYVYIYVYTNRYSRSLSLYIYIYTYKWYPFKTNLFRPCHFFTSLALSTVPGLVYTELELSVLLSMAFLSLLNVLQAAVVTGYVARWWEPVNMLIYNYIIYKFGLIQF